MEAEPVAAPDLEARLALGRRIDRYQRAQWWLICVVFALALALSAISLVATLRLGSIQTVQRRQTCIAKLQSDFAAAVGDALASPPAPNVARTDATSAISAAARALHNAETLCR